MSIAQHSTMGSPRNSPKRAITRQTNGDPDSQSKKRPTP